jgi:hypothetical protein
MQVENEVNMYLFCALNASDTFNLLNLLCKNAETFSNQVHEECWAKL